MPFIKQRYAAETLTSLIEHLRNNGYEETFGHCYESNTPSIKTIENCGFANQGRTGRQYNGNYELKFRIAL